MTGGNVYRDHSILEGRPRWIQNALAILLSFQLAEVFQGCVYESVIREPKGAHKIYHHGDVPLSEKKEFKKELAREAHTPVKAEEAGFFEIKKGGEDLLTTEKIYYVRRGAGPGHVPVFFLDGLEGFEPLGRRLEPVCDVVYLDLPSPDLALDEIPGLIDSVRKNLDLSEIVLVASEERFVPAVFYASSYPRHVKAVVSISGTVEVRSWISSALASVQSSVDGMAGLGSPETTDIGAYLRFIESRCSIPICKSAEKCAVMKEKAVASIEAFAYPGPEGGADALLSSSLVDQAHGLKRFIDFNALDLAEKMRKAGVLILLGGQDSLAQVKESEDLAGVVEQGRVVTVQGAGHRPDLEAWTGVLDAMTSVLGIEKPLPPPSPSPLDLTWESPGGLDRAKAQALLAKRCSVPAKRKMARICKLLGSDRATRALGIGRAAANALASAHCGK